MVCVYQTQTNSTLQAKASQTLRLGLAQPSVQGLLGGEAMATGRISTVDEFGCGCCLQYGASHLALRHGRLDGSHAGGDEEALQVRLEVVQVPVYQLDRFEHAMASATRLAREGRQRAGIFAGHINHHRRIHVNL